MTDRTDGLVQRDVLQGLIEKWLKAAEEIRADAPEYGPNRDYCMGKALGFQHCAEKLSRLVLGEARHSKDCASWRGVSAHPESEPLPCDCHLSKVGEARPPLDTTCDHDVGRPCRELWPDHRDSWCEGCINWLVPPSVGEARQEERKPDYRVLASAMRKMLPPALLAEVIAHLDPLTPFVEYLHSVGEARQPEWQESTRALERLRDIVNRSRFSGVDSKGPRTERYHWPMHFDEVEDISKAALAYVVACEHDAADKPAVVAARQEEPQEPQKASMRDWPLCRLCEGNGVLKIPGGVSVCPRCRQTCYEPPDAVRESPVSQPETK